jgi:hypothetical protein
VNSNPPQTHKLGNISHAVNISLVEAATGKAESLIIPREDICETCWGTGKSWREEGTCSNCSNKGYVRYEKRFEVRIPAGVESGAKLRIPGEGNLEAEPAGRGDLYITVNVSPHELFERKGKDLHSFFRLTQEELKRGVEVIVPTLVDGQKRLRVPPGTSAGAMLRLAGLGLGPMDGGVRGDLFVRVGDAPVKYAGGNTSGPSTGTQWPATAQASAAKQFFLSHAKGLIFTGVVLLLFAGSIYFGGRRRSGLSVPPTPYNANVGSTPAATPATRYTPAPAPTAAQPPRPPFSLPNGTNIVPPKGPRGGMRMTIINSGFQDIALKVVDSSSQKTRRFVYVRAQEKAFITNLPREVCLLRWETGTDWDVDARRFLVGRSVHQFDDTFDMRRTHYTVDFTPSETGTLRELSIDESEFEDK